MNEEHKIIITVKNNGEILTLDINQLLIDTDDLYRKFDVISTFLTYTNQSIENVYVERANEINDFEINEAIKVLNGEINTLEDKILELESELKVVKEINSNYSNKIDELMGKNATMYNEFQELKELYDDRGNDICQLFQEKGILQDELQKYKIQFQPMTSITTTHEDKIQELTTNLLTDALNYNKSNPYKETGNKTFYANLNDNDIPII